MAETPETMRQGVLRVPCSPDLPGSGVHRGQEEPRQFVLEPDDAFHYFRAEPLDVVALNVDRGGVVHPHRCFADRETALRAAGLEN